MILYSFILIYSVHGAEWHLRISVVTLDTPDTGTYAC